MLAYYSDIIIIFYSYSCVIFIFSVISYCIVTILVWTMACMIVIIMVLVWAVEWVMDEKLTPARLPTTQGQGHDGDGEALGDGDGDT